jgi:hypothetical protein
VYLPTYCPKANPIEQAFGDGHDKRTRNHQPFFNIALYGHTTSTPTPTLHAQ